jgi:hydroxyethylthiazole kinase
VPAIVTTDAIGDCLERLRAKRPLVHNITNYVVMNFSANVLLAIGASPAMVHAPEEVEEFVAISSALVVNIGTLDTNWIRSMALAAGRAKKAGIPWALDPVGAGATKLRTRTAVELLALSPTALRGNASEIIAVSGAAGHAPKGVDATVSSEQAVEAAQSLAAGRHGVVAATGATDYVVADGRRVALTGGSPLSQTVTGTGCAATALVGAFLGVEPEAVLATACGLAVLKAAAAMAGERGEGPGTFQIALLDALHRVSAADIARHVRIEAG